MKRPARELLIPGLVLTALVLCAPACKESGTPNGIAHAPESAETDSYYSARRNMVNRQIEARGIRDERVLQALRTVPRHRFVPERYRRHAYVDSPLPIGEGQTISQPYIVAFMTEVLALSATDTVLEIGTGSGYQAAVLGEIAGRVYSIEIVEILGRRAERTLRDLGYDNIRVKIGDGYQGWPEHGPFDAIIVTCSPSHIPEPLREQLAEGGRMIIPVGGNTVQELVLLRKTRGVLTKERALPVRFVPMVDRTGRKY